MCYLSTKTPQHLRLKENMRGYKWVLTPHYAGKTRHYSSNILLLSVNLYVQPFDRKFCAQCSTSATGLDFDMCVCTDEKA